MMKKIGQDSRHTKKKRPESLIFVLVVLLFVAVFSAANLGLFTEPFMAWVKGESDFAGFAEAVQANYTSDEFWQKNNFLNINGLYARITGRRDYNDVIILDNGMITQMEHAADIPVMAKNIAKFADEIEDDGIEYLYIQAPYKCDLEGELLPTGITDFGNQFSDELLSILRKKGVRTYDLRQDISAAADDIEKYYFRTDHHWNNTGAFVAYQKTVEQIQAIFPSIKIDDMYTDISMWEKHTVEDRSLGSLGKRVGILYAGIDDYIYYTPKFETQEMSCAISSRREFFKGDFVEANMRLQNLEGDPDYFNKSAYAVYTGGNYPLVQHRNANAPGDLRILIFKDSYVLPVEAFLSTAFKEIDTIDPRYYSEESLATYTERFQPDIVITMIHSSYGPRSSVYGEFWSLEAPEKMGEEVITETHNRKLEMGGEGGYNNARIAALEADRAYTVSFSDVQVLEGDTEAVTLRVYDAKNEKVLCTMIFDIEYYRENGGFSWTFDTARAEGNELYLIAYAGIPGSTQGISLIYKDLTVQGH